MRDLAIALLMPLLLYLGFQRAFISLGLWLWTSAFTLGQLLYGFMGPFPFNQTFAILTFVSYGVHATQRNKFIFDTSIFWIFVFFIITTFSSFFQLGLTDVTVWFRWDMYSKIVLFYIMTTLIVNKKVHFDFMAWMLLISIGALGAAEGTKFIFSGGAHRISWLRGISGDNNFVGLLIVVVLPLAYYLFSQVSSKVVKIGFVFTMLLLMLGLVATYSRGAFIGLVIVLLSFVKGSKNKLSWILAFFLIGLAASNFLPDTWFTRMDTVGEAKQDSSFLGRVMVWKMSYIIASHNLFGGGFKAVEQAYIWRQYLPYFDSLDFIPSAIPADHGKAAHSIYFQVLGDHGFLGLFAFLMILLTSYFKITRLIKLAVKEQMDEWIIILSKMLKLSLTVYCISGALLSAAYADFIYAILAMIFCLEHRIVRPAIEVNTKKEIH